MTEESNEILAIESDQDLERSAVAGAAAVERLISDRNNLRNLLAAHERELAASRAAQESLKRRLGVLHQRYIELGKSIVSQLQQFDCAMREAMSDRSENQNGEAASAPVAKSQFDSNGLPVASRPNGLNGHHQVRGLPLEP
jgi:phage shock protein A